MTERSARHATFVIERHYDASPKRVFAAFADPEAKFRWFVNADGWETQEYSLDFREGGQEIWRGGPAGGPSVRNDTLYQDIVPNERIVFSYAMMVNGNRISVSVSTIAFAAQGKGTHLTFTEQGVFLDGYDDPAGREAGTRALLDALDKEVRRGG